MKTIYSHAVNLGLTWNQDKYITHFVIYLQHYDLNERADILNALPWNTTYSLWLKNNCSHY